MSVKQDETSPVCILELVDEAEDFLSYCETHGVDPAMYRVVVLSTEVQVFLSKRGIAYHTTLDFFNNDSHADVVTHMEALQSRFVELVNLDLDEGVVRKSFTDGAIYISQYYINYFLFVVAVIDAAASNADLLLFSEMTGFPGAEAAPDVSIGPLLLPGEQFASAIARAYCNGRGIKHESFPSTRQVPPQAPVPEPSCFSSSFVRLGYRMLMYLCKKKSLVLYLGGGGTNGDFLTVLLRGRRHIRTIAFLDSMRMRHLIAGWARMFRLLRGHIPLVLEPQGAVDRSQTSGVMDQFAPDCLRGQLVYKGVDFWEIFGKKIQNQLIPFLENLGDRIDRRLWALDRVPVDYVVAASARLENFAVGEWANAKHIPFVMVPHGTAIKPANRFEDIENRGLGRSLLLSPVATVGVLQSKLDAVHVEHYAPPCRVVETGPILYADRDKAGRRIPGSRGRSSEPKTIMVASSYKTRGTMKFWAMETPDEYLQSCRDVVTAVNEMDDTTRVLIRFHPKLTISPDDFRSLLPDSEKLDIQSGGRFLDALKRCDLTVNFASSSIEESIQNDVPVLLYDRWDRYQHCPAFRVDGPADIEPSAVYYLNRPSDLRETLETVVARHLRTNVDNKALFGAYQYPDAYVGNFVNLFSETPNSKDSILT